MLSARMTDVQVRFSWIMEMTTKMADPTTPMIGDEYMGH